MSIEGRAVPDYGAPFNFFFARASLTGGTVLGSAGILPAFVVREKSGPEPARRRRYKSHPTGMQELRGRH